MVETLLSKGKVKKLKTTNGKTILREMNKNEQGKNYNRN